LLAGEEEPSTVAGALLDDTSCLGGVWIPWLLELGNPNTVRGELCGTTSEAGTPGHVVLTIEPGGVVTMTTFCEFMAPTYTPEAGHAVPDGELVRCD
jgi:hypothetical protein